MNSGKRYTDAIAWDQLSDKNVLWKGDAERLPLVLGAIQLAVFLLGFLTILVAFVLLDSDNEDMLIILVLFTLFAVPFLIFVARTLRARFQTQFIIGKEVSGYLGSSRPTIYRNKDILNAYLDPSSRNRSRLMLVLPETDDSGENLVETLEGPFDFAELYKALQLSGINFEIEQNGAVFGSGGKLVVGEVEYFSEWRGISAIPTDDWLRLGVLVPPAIIFAAFLSAAMPDREIASLNLFFGVFWFLAGMSIAGIPLIVGIRYVAPQLIQAVRDALGKFVISDRRLIFIGPFGFGMNGTIDAQQILAANIIEDSLMIVCKPLVTVAELPDEEVVEIQGLKNVEAAFQATKRMARLS